MKATVFWEKPRLLVLTLGLILVAGLSSFEMLPRREDPEIQARFGTILTRLPGGDAARVEALVTDPIEDELAELPEIKRILSRSRAGISIAVFEFVDELEDNDRAMAKVRSKLREAEARLPPSAGRPELKEGELAVALIAGLSWEGEGEAPYGILRRLELEDRLGSLPGTRSTEVLGLPEEEILVELDPGILSGLGLSASEVSDRIARSDAKVEAGQLRGRESDFLIEVEGELDSLDRIRSLPIRTGRTGQVLRLMDLGRIRKAVRTPMADQALIDGRPGIAVSARISSGTRADRWTRGARELLDSFDRETPREIRCRLIFDQDRYTTARLRSLTQNFLFGTLCVTLVILILMGWRSALIVGSALPLTSLMVLAGLRFLDVPLHQMTVTGLVIALGLLIDNAIVMVDEMRKRLLDGMSIPQAIKKSLRHLTIPLLGSTLTTVLAFSPLLLMPGSDGDFVGPMAVTVVLALLSSFFLSLTVLPALVGFLGGPKKGKGLELPWLSRWYRRGLDGVLARPWKGILAGLALPILGFVQGSKLEEQFFPPADRDHFQVQIELPSQASLAQTRRKALELRELLLEMPGIERVHWFLGTGAPKFYYNLQDGRDDSSWFAQALVQRKEADGAREQIKALQPVIDRAFPEALSLVLQLEQGPSFAAPVELRILGPDLERLAELGEKARTLLARIPGVTHSRTSLIRHRPKLLFRFDPEEARLAGFEERDLARMLETNLEGRTGGSLLEETEELPVRVRLGRERRKVEEIASLALARKGSGRAVPLAALGDFELVPELTTIPHRNRSRINTVQAFLEAGLLPSRVLSRFEEELEGFELPPGYRLEFGGEA